MRRQVTGVIWQGDILPAHRLRAVSPMRGTRDSRSAPYRVWRAPRQKALRGKVPPHFTFTGDPQPPPASRQRPAPLTSTAGRHPKYPARTFAWTALLLNLDHEGAGECGDDPFAIQDKCWRCRFAQEEKKYKVLGEPDSTSESAGFCGVLMRNWRSVFGSMVLCVLC